MSWTCPKCDRELLKENQWHNCVKVSIDSLFTGKDTDLVLIFDKILIEIADWEDVLISTTQNCIIFVHRQTFLIIRPMKKSLDLKFYSNEIQQGDLITKSIYYSGKYENHVRIFSMYQVTPQLYNYFKASYRIL